MTEILRYGCTSVLLVLLLVATARGDTLAETLYSASFQGDNRDEHISPSCRAVPAECNLALNGATALPILVNPWEPVSINIRCLELLFLPRRPVASGTRLFVGNSFSPDVMLWLIPKGGDAQNSFCYPGATGFPFPAAAPDALANRAGQNDFTLPHIDMHLMGAPAIPWYWLPDAGKYLVILTVYYTKNLH
jgi:hypothetical protein